jgi:propanol-preferring alcohol dehydrogenase
MVLERPRAPLLMRERPTPAPAAGDILVEIAACGVCRTDLHVVDGELPNPKLPLVPGHEIVGRVAALGAGVAGFAIGERIGVPWLAYTCGVCSYCRAGHENLCDRPLFTGYTRDGGYATHALADARYCFPLSERRDDAEVAPFLCAGLIGWRSYRMAGAPPPTRGASAEGPGLKALGLYGFGAAAHILAQIAVWQGRRVYAFTRGGDIAAQAFAKSLGAVWAGGSDELPPEPLDAAIIFAPVGALVPLALKARTCSLRRHPHVGHSKLSLSPALGGTAYRFGRQSYARGRAGIPGHRTAGGCEDRSHALSACSGQ